MPNQQQQQNKWLAPLMALGTATTAATPIPFDDVIMAIAVYLMAQSAAKNKNLQIPKLPFDYTSRKADEDLRKAFSTLPKRVGNLQQPQQLQLPQMNRFVTREQVPPLNLPGATPFVLPQLQQKSLSELSPTSMKVTPNYPFVSPKTPGFQMELQKPLITGMAQEQQSIGEGKVMTLEQFKNWDVKTPEGGASKSPKTVMSWKKEDYETLVDLAKSKDTFRYNEVLGKFPGSTVPNSFKLKSDIKAGKEITIYRARPKGSGETKIIPGAYVSESLEYVKQHGENILGGDYEISSMKVFPDELMVYGDPHEFIYIPKTPEIGYERYQKQFSQPTGEGKVSLSQVKIPSDTFANEPTINAMTKAYKENNPAIMDRPIAVRKTKDGYTIIEGEHRAISAKRAGVEPPIVVLTDAQVKGLNAHEVDVLAKKEYAKLSQPTGEKKKVSHYKKD